MLEGKKKNSLEPSRCKDAIPCAGSSKDGHVVPNFLLAPLIFCSSASRCAHTGSSFSLAETLEEEEEEVSVPLGASEVA